MKVSAEDFARWRDDRVTQWVFAAILMGVEEQRALWMRTSWDNGTASPALLSELRNRTDGYMALIETPYEGWCEMLGEEPHD